MNEENETGTKVHYICQTYVEKKGARGQPSGLQIEKTLRYTAAAQAEERAEREFRSESCVGADAYMIIEEMDSGEVGAPAFFVRLGSVPDEDGS